jgi:isopentenyl diphosphate isomerase/L-lactate dehydrogenase-like FMN-dependent dehydrogenase
MRSGRRLSRLDTMANTMTEPLNLRDFEALARAHMEPGPFAYYAGGAGDEHTLRENENAFARRRFRPRMLVDVSRIDTSVTLLGELVAMPVGVAPTAQHRLAHPDGEAATSRAAAAAGVMFCASTSSSLSLEEIAAAAGPLRWFQFYTQDNAGPRTEALLQRAAAAGYRAIVLTVDLAVSGRRERELRESFDIGSLRFGNFPPTDAVADAPDNGLRPQDAPSAFTWDDLAWLRARTTLPLVLKGILTAEDARLAVEHGAAAVWVSNHGARQLDRSPASIEVLEEIVAAVAGRAEVYLDGGVRRGVDVATALALGARAVFLGRPILHALAANGEAGVTSALLMIKEELRNAMALLGTPTVADITRAHVV